MAAQHHAVLVAAAAHEEVRLVGLGARPVDDLHEREVVDLVAGVLLGEDAAGGRLQPLAVPAVVLRVGGREVLVGLDDARAELRLRRGQPAALGDRAADGEQEQQRADRDQDDGERAQLSTSRLCRCWPTLRLTRWRALSTVLQSQPRRSPITT